MHADPVAGGDNLFQPISMSHSNSSTSIGDVTKENSDVPLTPCSPKALEPPIARDSKSGVVTVLPEEKEAKPGKKLGKGDRKSDLSGVQSCRYSEGCVHQRSRSNEMDYVSLRSDGKGRPRLHSFRSPPGSMQTFTSCREEINPLPAQTNPNMGSPVASPSMSDDATHSANDRESCSESSGGETTEKVSANQFSLPERVSADQFSLLKEFDSSVWSNYFTSLETPQYSDC